MIRAVLQDMEEIVWEEIFEDTLVQGLTSNYDQVKFAIYRDSSYSLEQIRVTMRNLYLDDLSRKSSARGRSFGRGAAMTMAKLIATGAL